MSDGINPLLARMLRDISGSKRSINSQTQIYHELGIAGDDAHDLLTEIHKEFGTSFIDLDFSRYFPNEPEIFWRHLARLIGIHDSKRAGFSAGQLDNAIRNGFWAD